MNTESGNMAAEAFLPDGLDDTLTSAPFEPCEYDWELLLPGRGERTSNETRDYIIKGLFAFPSQERAFPIVFNTRKSVSHRHAQRVSIYWSAIKRALSPIFILLFITECSTTSPDQNNESHCRLLCRRNTDVDLSCCSSPRPSLPWVIMCPTPI